VEPYDAQRGRKKKLRLALIAQANGLHLETIDTFIDGAWYTPDELGRMIVEHAEIMQIANLIECNMMHFDLDKFGTYSGIMVDAVNFIIATKQELNKEK